MCVCVCDGVLSLLVSEKERVREKVKQSMKELQREKKVGRETKTQ